MVFIYPRIEPFGGLGRLSTQVIRGWAMSRTDTDRVYDELLVTLVRAGDVRAGERLAARWQPRLLRTARRLLNNDEQARDAVQEAWIEICRGWLSLSDPAKFPAWDFSILHRKCADRIKKAQKRRQHEAAPEAAPEPGVSGGVETSLSLAQAFASLSDEHRAAAVLFFSEGLTLAEIAIATGVPVGTAKSRIFHARRQLKAHLEGAAS